MSDGHLELAWAVDAIKVGRRVRVDLGDIDELAASIRATGGLLQPITITPDGWLVCGLRRLEAVKRLGWTTVNVWVRNLSSPLAMLLAEREENTVRKALTLTEAATVYREMKTVEAEDAARRQQATWLEGPGRQ
ncbi:MAG TPA: ParB N-terminal domain-containing protein, partial [Rugosimonospora sp.]|nr:ParB N-terminal domain-containing protein [Rugosimonospora sp.]